MPSSQSEGRGTTARLLAEIEGHWQHALALIGEIESADATLDPLDDGHCILEAVRAAEEPLSAYCELARATGESLPASLIELGTTLHTLLSGELGRIESIRNDLRVRRKTLASYSAPMQTGMHVSGDA